MADSNHKKILSRIDDIEKKIDAIKAEEDEVLRLEQDELNLDTQISDQEKEQLDELKKLEALEQEILEDVSHHPLRKVTYRDVTKGIIGAFFGIMGHFAFTKGVSLAADISLARANVLMLASFIIIVIFLYFAGFRKIDDEMLFKIMPIRAIVIYVTAISTIIVVLALYGDITFNSTFTEIYKTIATISILAVMGAGTADLIGGVEE